MKRIKYDLKCFNCEKSFVFSEEKEVGNIEIFQDYAVFWCSCCGEQTYIKHKGFKSKKRDY